MLAILAPAKTFHSILESELKKIEPLRFEEKTQKLIDCLKTYDTEELSKWMKMSLDLADLNLKRYESFYEAIQKGYAAIDYFNGEAYKGLEVSTLEIEARDYLSQHLIILSGLYGGIGPQEIIQPYRLEMGTKFNHENFKDLYQYWKKDLTDFILKQMEEDETERALINLASTEYSKAVDLKEISKTYPVINISFKEQVSEGAYKVVGMYAKKARGSMVRYMAQNKLRSVEELKTYDKEGYSFKEELSSRNHFVFVRHKAIQG